MSNMQDIAVRYIQRLPETKLNSTVVYLRYLCEQDFTFVKGFEKNNSLKHKKAPFYATLNRIEWGFRNH